MNRPPPHNIEAEQAVLAAVVLDNDALATAVEMLTPDDFYLQKHRVIYRAMESLFSSNQPVDFLTLISKLDADDALAAVGGPAAVSELAGRTSTAAN